MTGADALDALVRGPMPGEVGQAGTELRTAASPELARLRGVEAAARKYDELRRLRGNPPAVKAWAGGVNGFQQAMWAAEIALGAALDATSTPAPATPRGDED